MTAKNTVDDYIKAHVPWQEALMRLRTYMINSGLEENIKWGRPVYSWKGKNVLGIGAFKAHLGIWFFQGALLKDANKKLLNAQEGKTKAMRQWRFQSLSEVEAEESLILAYVEESIRNQEEGKEVEINRKKPLIVPEELQAAFDADGTLKGCFDRLSITRKREFAEYILEAKRKQTKQNRIEKIIPLILGGKGLHDQYKK